MKILLKYIKENPKNIPALKLLFSIYRATRKKVEMEQVLYTLIDLKPDDIKYVQKLADLYETWGTKKKYERILIKLTTFKSNEIEGYETLAKFYHEEKEYIKLEAVLITLTKLRPYEIQYARDLAKFYKDINSYSKAYKAYKILLELQPMALEEQFNMAEICLVLQKRMEAEEWFRFVLRLNPQHSKSWINLALLYEENDPRMALNVYKQMIDADPEADTHVLNHAKEIEGEDPNFAEKMYNLLITNSPEDTIYLARLRHFYLRQRKHKAAELLLRKITKIEAREKSGYHNAIRMMNFEKYSEAAKILLKATSQNPLDDVVWSKLGICEYKMGNLQEAIRDLQFALELNKYNTEAIEYLEKVDPKFKDRSMKEKYAHKLELLEGYFQNHRFEKARVLLQKILKENPEFPGAWHGLGKLYYYKNNMDQAWNHFLKAKLKMTVENAETYEFMGRIAYLRGDFNDAAMFYWKSIQIFPSNTQAYNDLAEVSRKLHKYEDMVECYQKSLEINPKQKEIHIALGEWFDACKDFNKAEKFFRNAEDAFFSSKNLDNLH